jgi:LTXXQ motif family protein
MDHFCSDFWDASHPKCWSELYVLNFRSFFMKSSISILFLILSFIPAHADVIGKPEPSSPSNPCIEKEQNAKSLDQSLSELETRLKLTAAQTPLWQDWSLRLKTAHQIKEQNKKKQHEWRNLAAPLRQEKWMASVQDQLNSMQASLPSLKSLYSSFNEEQKLLFDREIPFKHNACGTREGD